MNTVANNCSIDQFVIIDDTGITLFLCKIIIQKSFENVPVVSFNSPTRAIEYFNTYFCIRPMKTIVFLDINMPEYTGWEVLESLNDPEGSIKEHTTVFMLSSSIDPENKRRAIKHPMVAGYLEKPLSRTSLAEALQERGIS